MGRPKGGTNVIHSKEEKLVLVKRNLAGESLMLLERETGIYHAQIYKWTKQYLDGGETALVNKRKPGNPLAKYTRKKRTHPNRAIRIQNCTVRARTSKERRGNYTAKKSIELERGDAKRK